MSEMTDPPAHATEDVDALADDIRRVAARYADPDQFVRDLVDLIGDLPPGVDCCLTGDDVRVLMPDNPDRTGWLITHTHHIRYRMLRAGFQAAEDIREGELDGDADEGED